MANRLIVSIGVLLTVGSAVAAPKVAFDLSHGQFQDVFVKPSYYDYVLPEYREICKELGAEYAEIKDGVTSNALADVKTLVMISPLARSTQKPITAEEKAAITAFIERGGSVLMFVDEEEYRVILSEYGANDITRKFGIEIGNDIEGLPGNCGAVSFENEIFGGRLLSIHNIHCLMRLTEKIRQAIYADSLMDFRNDFMAVWREKAEED